MRERPDVTVSLYPSESSFIPDIKDGSRKVLELHFNRYFRLQYGRSGLAGLIDRLRCRQDVALASRFDRFVVLTEEDKGYWGDMSNISVIPNAALPMPEASDWGVLTIRKVLIVLSISGTWCVVTAGPMVGVLIFSVRESGRLCWRV